MANRSVPVAAAFLLAICTLADEPWKGRSYKDWNEEQVKRVLNNSPWAKGVGVPADWTRFGHEGFEVGQTIRIGKAPADADLERNDIASFTLRWASSRTIRAAAAREAVLRGQMQPGDAEKNLASEPTEYEVALVVTDYTVRFPRATEAEMQRNSYLQPAKSGVKVTSTRVRIRRERGHVAEVNFYFPKTIANGRPLITPDETLVEFRWSVGGASVWAKFEPQKMRDKSGIDL